MANIYKNVLFSQGVTTITDLYTVPSNSRAIIQNIQVTNETGSVNVQVYVYDNSTTTEHEISHVTVAARSTENMAKGPVILEESDVLRIQAATIDTVSGIISILEINRD